MKNMSFDIRSSVTSSNSLYEEGLDMTEAYGISCCCCSCCCSGCCSCCV